jgi:hypothetical protein
MGGQTGAAIETYNGVPIWRIDYKNSLIYLPTLLDAALKTVWLGQMQTLIWRWLSRLLAAI